MRNAIQFTTGSENLIKPKIKIYADEHMDSVTLKSTERLLIFNSPKISMKYD